MIRSEFIARVFNAISEEGRHLTLDDQGIATSLFYGLSDNAILSFRHDLVTGVDGAHELEFDHQRLSPALTTRLGPNKRFQTRLQYDYNDSDAFGEEHVGWLQLQYFWGGSVGG